MTTLLFQTEPISNNSPLITDWFSIVISTIALLLSGASILLWWLHHNKKFDPIVIPGTRLIIGKMITSDQEMPFLGLECSYENKGVLTGKIDGLAIKTHKTTGSDCKLIALLVRDFLDIVPDLDQMQNMRNFSTLYLGEKERRGQLVVFTSIDRTFDIAQACTLTIKLSFCPDFQDPSKWISLPISRSFDVDDKNVEMINSGRTIRLEANELIQSRNHFLENG